MIYVFSGPTLPAEEGRKELDAIFLPPAVQGDVYRAALDRPRAIGLIDGYFERVPAVWHKEILWAMSEGIHVYGGGSMGALRAAELAPFGMRGVGAVFEAFARGELEDDDEVALSHAREEDGFRPLSEAMVDIRATLAAAERAGVLRAQTRASLERLAKSLYYPDRSYPALLARASAAALPGDEVEALRAWLPRGRVRQKHEDALALLRTMREELRDGAEPKRVSYSLSRTEAWEEACLRAERLRSSQCQGRRALAREALVEELRVCGAFPRARQGALVRALAEEEARRQGYAATDEQLQAACGAFRLERGLLAPGSLERWLAEQHIAEPESFFQQEAGLRWIETLLEPEIARGLQGHLQATGEYGPLLERLRRKHRVLAEAGLEQPGLVEAGFDGDEALWRWYFEERLGRPIPPHLGGYARGLGFENEDALRRAVLRERCFLRREAAAAASQTP